MVEQRSSLGGTRDGAAVEVTSDEEVAPLLAAMKQVGSDAQGISIRGPAALLTRLRAARFFRILIGVRS